MKTYYLTLSKYFPQSHPKAGQPTNFEEKVKAGQMFNRGEQEIPTYPKVHTIRANYEFWKKRFEQIERGEACLSIRQWVGKPYGKGSSQREIMRLTKEDGIGIQKLKIVQHNNILQLAYICSPSDKSFPNKDTELLVLAMNDGLTLENWRAWFKGYDLTKPLAVIHFTKFRY